MDHSQDAHGPNFNEFIDEQPYNNLNTSRNFSDPTYKTSNYERTSFIDNRYATLTHDSYVSQYNHTISRRRIQRQMRRITNSNTLLVNWIIQLPLQNTNNSFANQLFNGGPF